MGGLEGGEVRVAVDEGYLEGTVVVVVVFAVAVVVVFAVAFVVVVFVVVVVVVVGVVLGQNRSRWRRK